MSSKQFFLIIVILSLGLLLLSCKAEKKSSSPTADTEATSALSNTSELPSAPPAEMEKAAVAATGSVNLNPDSGGARLGGKEVLGFQPPRPPQE